MQSNVSIYTTSFRDLIYTLSNAIGEDVSERVNLVLKYPVFSTCLGIICAKHASENLTKEDMESAADLVDATLPKGGHAMIFYSAIEC